ncbi:MAG: hypothetical protein HYU66_21185 [Armatimonadetes bacterium]|nr:hypothetical protein [Armatimonadota bacterium]
MSEPSHTPAPDVTPQVPAAPRRSKARGVLVMLLVFGSGVVCGGGATVLVAAKVARVLIREPDRAAGWIARRVSHKLRLDPEQRQQVAEIVRSHREAIRQIREQAMPDVKREVNAIFQEIDEVLRPEQQTRWHAMEQRLRRWRPPPPADEPQTP